MRALLNAAHDLVWGGAECVRGQASPQANVTTMSALSPSLHVGYRRRVQQLFDRPWDSLDVESVKRFLADADDEGVLWEAKGTQVPNRDSVRKAVCGFANALGGYLILGAQRRNNASWELTGLQFRHPEPGTWVGSLIAAGVSPLPVFDSKPFELGDGRQAVVVQVEPVTMPPCITASGVVYQRVSGQTLPVTDQRVLADLLEKGATARRRTEEAALTAARTTLGDAAVFEPETSVFAMALCATGGPADRAAKLFDKNRATSFHHLVTKLLQPDQTDHLEAKSEMRQDCLRVWTGAEPRGQGNTAKALWDGTVAVVLSDGKDDYGVPHLTSDVGRFWRALAHAVELFGGRGDAHLVVVVNPSHPGLRQSRGAAPRTDVRRWTEVREPTDAELGSVVRELERGFGRIRWEPSSSTSPKQ